MFLVFFGVVFGHALAGESGRGTVIEQTMPSVSTDGASAAIGAWIADVGGNTNQGAAYVAELDIESPSGPELPVIEVDDGAVEVADDGDCSLIEAFENAVGGAVHADCEPGDAEGAIISLWADSIYTLTTIHGDTAGPTGLPSVIGQILLEGNGAAIERPTTGAPPFRLLHVAETGNLVLSDITLRNGLLVDPAHSGAGIHNAGTLAVDNASVHSHINSPAGGGAIFNADGATLTVFQSTLRNNGGPGSGAAIFNAAGATADVTHSTLAENSCGGPGCGIHNAGMLTMSNSTLSDNSGPLANGVNNMGTAVLSHVTMAANSGGQPHSFLNGGQATLSNTLIAGDVENVDSCSGAPVVYEGVSLIEDGSCGCAAEPACLDGNPLIGDLEDNGGPTPTHALLVDSIAIDAAGETFCAGDDQRGVSRPQGEDCDIGAYEAEVEAPGQPELQFDPVSLDFGGVPVGTTSAPQSATLSNVGDGIAEGLTFLDISSAGYDVDASDCGVELPAGDSCEVVIAFTPPGEGAFNPTLVVTQSGHPPGFLALAGNGVVQQPPAIDVDPESLSVSLLQGDLEIRSLTIANLGDETLKWFVADDLSEFRATVEALTVWDDGDGPALYVGGSASATFNSDFKGIARWDGEEWSLLGTGVGGTGLVQVNALTEFDDALIVAGTFTIAGGVVVNRIARWDGEVWSPLGPGLDGRVNALAVFDGELIAGGQFGQAGGLAASNIARWDGSSWSPLDSGLNSSVNDLAVHDGALFAAGTFTDAGGTPASRVARWDGVQWSPLGAGVGTTVNALTVFDGDVIATGFFGDAGGAPANRIARWDGNEWFPLGDGLGSLGHTLEVFEDTLIVGGAFTEAGGMPANRIARWDGEEWSPVGAGFLNPVRALAVFDGDLIAGGSFTQPGTPPANRIARWDGNEWLAMVTDPAACALPDWLSVDPDAGEVEGGDEQTLSVIIDTSGLELGDYQTEVCIVNTDQSSAVVTVPVELSVTAAPEADISPDAFAFQVPPDGSAGDVLNIANIGASDLVWSIEADNPDNLVAFDDIDYTVPANQWGGSVRWDTGETCDLCQNPPNNFNVWLTGSTNELAFFWPGQEAAGGGGVTLDDGGTYAVLERGAAVGQHSEFFRRAMPDATVHWRDAQGVDGYLGFRFVNPDTSAVNFGYARITTTGTTGHPATIVSWVYDQAGNPIAVAGCDDPADIPWLSINADSGTTAPDQSSTVDVSVDATGLEPGEQRAQLCVATNDPGAPLVAIPVDLTVLGPEPIADIGPDALEFELPQGGSDADVLNIGNIGLDDLEWGIETAGRGTGGTDVVEDGGFEAGTPNPSWEEGSTNFNTPLCDVSCGLAGAHNGNWWAWFGGTGDADESGFLAQEVIIPPTDNAQLRFWLHIDSAFTPGTFEVRLDNDVLFSATDADASDFPVYTEVIVDVTAFADGQPYELRFEGETQAGGITNFFVDDVRLLIDAVDIGCDNPADISWLQIDPATGITPPGGSVPVDVMVDAADLAPGEYQAQLCVTTNDPQALLVEIPVTLEVPSDPPPQIDVDPDSLSATVPAGQTEIQPLTIANLGVETLEWQVTETGRSASVPIPARDTAQARRREAIPAGLESRLFTSYNRPPATGGVAAVQPVGGIVDCDNEPGIIVHDNGTMDDGYSVDPAQYGEVTLVDLFTPDAYPATFTAVCVAFVSLGSTSLDFEIVVYADDGPGGVPGTELGAMSATADGIPVGQHVVAWSSFDITGLNLSIESGSAYIGVRWPPGTDVFLGADESPDNPVGFAGGHVRVDTIDDWFPNQSVFAGYRAMFVRAVEAPAEPPIDCSLPGWIAVSPGAGSVSGGGEQTAEVTFDAGVLLPGEYETNLCIASNDPVNGLVVVPVTLTVDEAPVLPGELSLDPGALDFGEVPIGTSPVMSFTVSNVADPGAESLELSAIELPSGAPEFQLAGGDCDVGLELPPQASCTVEVGFSPGGEQAYLGAILVVTHDGQDGTVDLNGLGVEVPDPGDEIFTDRFEEGVP